MLRQDDSFCAALGAALLAAGRLESTLTCYFYHRIPDAPTKKATLGKLISIAKDSDLLVRMLPALESLKDQRNYLTHNIHALFTGLVEETLLPKSGLLDSDVDLFTDRATDLQENLDALANIVAKTP